MVGGVPNHSRVSRPARIIVPAVLLLGVGVAAVLLIVVKKIANATAIPASSVGRTVVSVFRRGEVVVTVITTAPAGLSVRPGYVS